MLTEWTIGNFKSIGRPVTLRLAPLTVLVGANSSGKSTLLQSILMIAQTLQVESPRALILNGQLVRLGYAADIVHEGRRNPMTGSYASTGYRSARLLTNSTTPKDQDLEPIRLQADFEPLNISMSSASGFERVRATDTGRKNAPPTEASLLT